MNMCLHCEEERATRSRGLGHRCYAVPAIREMYPVRDQYARIGLLPEPTMEQLEKLIAEQLPTMPVDHGPHGEHARRTSIYGVIALRPVSTRGHRKFAPRRRNAA